MNSGLMKHYFLIFASLLFVKLSAQVDNTMYGLYQTANPSGFQFGTIDPETGGVKIQWIAPNNNGGIISAY